MAKRVNAVQLGGFRIPVVYRKLTGGDLGLYRYHRGPVIEIESDLDPHPQAAALFHEVIEALNDHPHLGLSETKVRALEFGLIAFIDANGELVDALSKGKA